MIEIKLDGATNLEEEIIVSSKKYKKIYRFNLSTILSISIITIIINPSFLKYSILDKLISLLFILGASCCINSMYNIITEFIYVSKNTKSMNKLKKIVKCLSYNNINTNTNELSNSVIIKKEAKTIKEVTDDGKYETIEDTTEDKYYLYLDNNSNIQGILEHKNTTVENFDLTDEDVKYYILEQKELKELENKVTKVKKLVKKI